MTRELSGVDTKSVQEAEYECETEVYEVVGKLLRGGNPMILPFR